MSRSPERSEGEGSGLPTLAVLTGFGCETSSALAAILGGLTLGVFVVLVLCASLSFLSNQADKAEGAPCIGSQHLYLLWSRRKPGIQAYFQPLEPVLPPVWNRIGSLHLNQPCLFPMLLPPLRAVEAPPIPLPVRSQVSWDLPAQFLENVGHDYP